MDRISNMLSTIKNAAMSGKKAVEMFHTNECEKIAKLMKENDFLHNVKVFKYEKSSKKGLHIDMYENDNMPKISNVKIFSKPGHRVYKKHDDLQELINSGGVGILSTSRGLITLKEAKKKKLGGELICMIFA